MLAMLFIAALGIPGLIDARGVAAAIVGWGKEGGGGDGVGSGGGDSYINRGG